MNGLEEKLKVVNEKREWPNGLVLKFIHLVEYDDDDSLYRMNPYTIASKWQYSTSDCIDFFLHCSRESILILNWRLICSRCGDSIEDFRKLKDFHSHFYCTFCRREYESYLDDYILVDFTIHPTVRKIKFHNPNELSLEDFYYKYHFSREGHFPGSRLLLTDWLKSLELSLVDVKENSKQIVKFQTKPGYVIVNNLMLGSEFYYSINEEEKVTASELTISFDGKQIRGPENAVLKSGENTIYFENASQSNLPLAFFQMGQDFLTSEFQLEFDPFLTGKQLITNKTYNQLFQTEAVIGPDALKIRDLTFFFSDLKGSTALYERIGDIKAFSLVQSHFEEIAKVIKEYNGYFVKTIGDAIMAVFLNANDAFVASRLILEVIAEFNRRHHSNDILLKIGIHRGPAIAVTLNEKIDYFGQTVNIAARIQGLAEENEICISKETGIQKANVSLSLGESILEESVFVKGVVQPIDILRFHKNTT